MIVCVTGTGPAFPRLVEAVARYGASVPNERIWIQHGRAPRPDGVDGAALVSRQEILSLMSEADVVVCHGGCGTIYDAISLGHVPVVVPRLSSLGEHVNDHQHELVSVLEAQGRVVALRDMAQLPDAIQRARSKRTAPISHGQPKHLVEALRVDGALAARGQRAATQMAWRLMRWLTRGVPLRMASPGGE